MTFEEFKKITSEYEGNLIGNMFQNYNKFTYDAYEDIDGNATLVKKTKNILTTITLETSGGLCAEEATCSVKGGVTTLSTRSNENCLRQMLKEYNFKLKSGYQLSLFL